MLSLAMALYVILSAYEVPQEVSPVHVVYLVVDEERKVVQLCRHGYPAASVLRGNGVAYLVSYPFFVVVFVVGAVHAGEQHVLCSQVLLVVFEYPVFAFLVVTCVDRACIDALCPAVLIVHNLGTE